MPTKARYEKQFNSIQLNFIDRNNALLYIHYTYIMTTLLRILLQLQYITTRNWGNLQGQVLTKNLNLLNPLNIPALSLLRY